MLHPDVRLGYIDDVVGYGVFVTRALPKGTITWVQDPLDQVFDSDAFARLESGYGEILAKYTWINRDGNRVLCWDFGKYMNHSCEANTLSPGLEFEIAIRDIAAGEQLTADYGALNVETPLVCVCGSARCRGVIREEDFEVHAPRWDAEVRSAFPWIAKVEQRLWPWVMEKEAIAEGLRDAGAIPSILRHRYAGMRVVHPGMVL